MPRGRRLVVKEELEPPPQIDPSQKRLLAHFLQCASCNCIGWRRHPSDGRAQSVAYLTEEDANFLMNTSSDALCASCSHTLSRQQLWGFSALSENHMARAKQLSEEELTQRILVSMDLTELHKLYGQEEGTHHSPRTNEEKNLLLYVCQDLRDYLESSGTAHQEQLDEALSKTFGKPDFEGPSLAKIVGCYVNVNTKGAKPVQSKKHARCAALFLKALSEFELPPPELCKQKYPWSINSEAYALVFARWFIFCRVPRLCPNRALKRHSPVEVFGKAFLQLVFPPFLEKLREKVHASPSQQQNGNHFHGGVAGAESVLQELYEFANGLLNYIRVTSSAFFSHARVINYSTAPNVFADGPVDLAEDAFEDSFQDTLIEVKLEDGGCNIDRPSASGGFTTLRRHRRLPSSLPHIPDALMQRAIARYKRQRDAKGGASAQPVRRHRSSLEEQISGVLSDGGYEEGDGPLEMRKSVAEQEEAKEMISFYIISNSLEHEQSDRKLSWLIQLQRLFGVQLPKMPKDYVTRLVFDHRHKNLVVHKAGKGVIGGICFRPFQEQGFIEIVFCAITADEQVKGYGTLMMNHMKDFQVNRCRIYHLLTYADEFAIGYFKKQDFITDIMLPTEKYKGYIKEYEGATLMACQLHPKIIYTKYRTLFRDMHDLYMCIVKEKYPNLGKKYGGVEHLFQENGGKPLTNEMIPGFDLLSSPSDEPPEPITDLTSTLKLLLGKLKADKNAWPFLQPVNEDEVPEYFLHIPFPIDLGTIADRIKDGYYTHEHLFMADVRRMFANCYKFNGQETLYYMHGYRLNECFNKLARTYLPNMAAKLSADFANLPKPSITSSATSSGKRRY